MKLIVGLGNRGEEYQNNRHNVGFQFLDFIIENLKIPNSKTQISNKISILRSISSISTEDGQNPNFQKDKKLNAEICQLQINNEKIILAKPQSFMNQTGIVVKSCVLRYALQVTQDLYIVHDDLDLRLGEFKIQKGKGPKLHNGILSIEKTLGTLDFWRIRIGVDNREADNRIPGEAYVLQNFTEEEFRVLEKVFHDLINKLLQLEH